MTLAQITAHGAQAGFVELTLPERFLRFFSSRSRPMRGNQGNERLP
jgi:hypothetical protein